MLAKDLKGGAQSEAEKLKSKIQKAKNTADIYSLTGNVYYINRDMPISAIPSDLEPGDAVLFERGGLWRTNAKEIPVPEGVTFGSYGKGEKPKFYGSVKNFAEKGSFKKEKNNLFSVHVPGGNIGNIVFNETDALGVKKWEKKDLKENFDFFYEPETEVLYLYYDKGNLEDDFYDIEISPRGNMFTMHSGATVDNVCIKYVGAHGINAEHQTEGCTVTNCEIGFIGGSMQFDHVRFGNGIEFPIGTKDTVVKRNYVYEVYDAGLTFQSWGSAKKSSAYDNVLFAENLVEYCHYAFEFFTTDPCKDIISVIKDVVIKDNIFRYSGYGWSYEQRPDKWEASAIRGGQRNYYPYTMSLTFKNNIFDCAATNLVFWYWNDKYKNFFHEGPHPGVKVKGNTFYQSKNLDNRCITYNDVDPMYATDYESLKKAAEKFDSSPKKIEWIE